MENHIPLHNRQETHSDGKIAIILLNLGTPASPQVSDVRRYLAEFLGDPEVISLLRGWKWATPLLGKLIAFFRASQSAANYAQIWTEQGSPLLNISRQQAALLEEELGSRFKVWIAMRYGKPTLTVVFDEVSQAGINEVVLLPMYPHYSGTTTGTALKQAYRLLAQCDSGWKIHPLVSWHDYPPYLDAQAQVIQDYVTTHQLSPETSVLLFSAHGLPVSYMTAGDPYQTELTASIEGITSRLSWSADRIRTAYQSHLGPVAWLQPSTEQTLRDLAIQGVKSVVVCPVSFMVDCIETIHELGIEYRKLFEVELGGKLWLIPALNTAPVFIQALKSLVVSCFGGK
jgi:ferrochelatase